MCDSPTKPRVKRQKVDKGGRFAALEKLKKSKNQDSKSKWATEEEVDNVYDIVDETEFSKRSKDLYNDWIEDDGTGAYCEDGRDYFEDEDEYYEGDAKSKKGKGDSRKRSREEEKPAKNKKSIRDIFKAAATKESKKVEADTGKDDALDDILGELDSGSSSNIKPKAMTIPKRVQRASAKQETDDDMLDRLLKSSDSSKPKKPETVATITRNPTPEPEKNGIKDVPAVPNDDDDLLASIVEEEPSLPAPPPKKKKIVEDAEDMKNILSNWDSICNPENFEEEMVAPEAKTEEMKENLNNNEVLKFWYWDAWEDPVKRPGEVFLFGKIAGPNNTFKSMCIHVTGIEKIIYLCPRKFVLDSITKEKTNTLVTMDNVQEEFEKIICKEMGLNAHRSRVVTKNFSFLLPEAKVPQTSEYLEVRYDPKNRNLNTKNKYDYIEHIFGANTSSLETFILDRKIKGPCWLNISNYSVNNSPMSWCDLEIRTTYKGIAVREDQKAAPPPLSLMTINVRCVINPKTLKNEIVMLSILTNDKFYVDKPAPKTALFNGHFCGFTRPGTACLPTDHHEKLREHKAKYGIQKLDTEKALLSWFMNHYKRKDPDLVVTFDAKDCQLDVICDRVQALKLGNWSNLGKLRMSDLSNKREWTDFFTGRMVCDVKKSAEELILKLRNYELGSLCKEVLKEENYFEVNNNSLVDKFGSSEGIIQLIQISMTNTLYILRLMYELNIMPLAIQISNICGFFIGKTLQGGRSERNEYLLLHAFNEKNYIVPDKRKHQKRGIEREEHVIDMTQATQTDMTQVHEGETTVNANGKRKKAAYAGGLVLDPVKGLYDSFILLMDFNSLYPSIIQEYNICFTTIDPPVNPEDQPAIPDPKIETGVLPRQIKRLVESRREVKKLMANPNLTPELKQQYDIRQHALKLTANSMYGCLGFSNSRFFAQHLASLVTFKGREILMNTKNLVQKMNYEVVYGDTDSIMVNTNIVDYDQVFKIGSNIKQTINKVYRNIELDIDGVMKYLLLLKKKKYACLLVSKKENGELSYKREQKGLDIVRRDWSIIAKKTGDKVLDEICSEKPRDDKVEGVYKQLEHVQKLIIDGEVPASSFSITKKLTKNPKDYSNAHSMPHVLVALRMNTHNHSRYKSGDTVEYVICDDGTQNAATQRAYHLDELKNGVAGDTDKKVKIDTTYYFEQQIHPVISRLCEPLEGLDRMKIAECLGLDPQKFKGGAVRSAYRSEEASAGESLTKSNLQKFRLCEKFKFLCVQCKTENIVASGFRPSNTSHVSVLQNCTNTDCSSQPFTQVGFIRNQLILQIKRFIRRFYDNWLVCDDPACNVNTRVYSHVNVNNLPVCLICKQGSLIRQYTETDLYVQLCYFQYMFDLTKYEHKNINTTPEIVTAYNLLKETVDQFLNKSAYSNISLYNVFRNIK